MKHSDCEARSVWTFALILCSWNKKFPYWPHSKKGSLWCLAIEKHNYDDYMLAVVSDLLMLC